MGLQLRRGTNAERLGITPLEGELIYTTDTQNVFVGNGTSPGGIPVTVFTSEDAQDAVATLFSNGTHSGITFSYNDTNNTISATVTATETPAIIDLTDVIISNPTNGQVLKYNNGSWINGADAETTGIANIVEDTAPQLGGNLDLNSNDITGTGNIGIAGTLSVTGLGSNLNLNSKDITGTGNIDITGTLRTTTGLGGNLNLNSKNITGTGNIDITGTVRAVDGLGGDLALNNFTIKGSGFVDLTGSVTVKGGGIFVQRNEAGLPYQEVRVVVDTNGVTAPSYQIACRGSLATPAAVQEDDFISSWSWLSHDGTNVTNSGGLIVLADTVGENDIAAKIYIVTTPNNYSSLDKGLAITQYGVGVNTGSVNPQATLDVNGFAKLAVLSAAPTSPTNGMVAIADGTTWDPAGTGKSVMVVYLGGGWRVAATAP